MKIRAMEIADYQAVYDLWMSCKGMGLNNIDDSRSGIEKFLKNRRQTAQGKEHD